MKKIILFSIIMLLVYACSDDSTTPNTEVIPDDNTTIKSTNQADIMLPMSIGNKWQYKVIYEDSKVCDYNFICKIDTSYYGLWKYKDNNYIDQETNVNGYSFKFSKNIIDKKLSFYILSDPCTLLGNYILLGATNWGTSDYIKAYSMFTNDNYIMQSYGDNTYNFNVGTMYINSILYYNVIEITINSTSVIKIYLSPGYGIIYYQESDKDTSNIIFAFKLTACYLN